MSRTHYVTPKDDLQAVFDGAGENDVILFAEGDYRCKTMIRTPGLTLVGAGAGRTRLIYNDYARKMHPIGGEFNTFRTYTLAVCADRVTIRDLSVINDALQPEKLGQEVALSVVGNDFLMERCTLTSTQDTLFLGPLPSDLIGRYEGFLDDSLRAGYWMKQRFESCLIEGTVDFIFGCGDTLLQNCEIRSLWDARDVGGEFNTFRTYTLAVCADRVTIRDLSVINDALQPEKLGQEVALSVVGNDFLMERCTLTSTQDTLFLGPLPSDLIGRYEGFLDDSLRAGYWMKQRFESCLIEGTVDFIFGCGDTLLQNCEIRSLWDARDVGYVAAPAHDLSQTEGFRFRNCRFTCEEGVTPGSIYLARPWRDFGISRFEDCMYGSHIAEEGFDKWNGTHRDLTARFYESPAVPGRVAWCNRI